MTSFKPTKLDPELNIHGSITQTDMLVPADEFNKLGSVILGQTGATASIVSASGGLVTITGLTGMTSNSITRVINISGAADPNNNGAFTIVSVISSSSVVYANSIGAAPDANNSLISWQERNNYSLQDDLNYTRTDRSNIKGVSYYSAIPTYQRPDNIGINIPTNLVNIADHTTDAVSFITDHVFYGAPIGDGYTKITLTSVGNLKHADNVNTTGVPVFDTGPFAGDYASCNVVIKNASVTDGELSVLTGPHTGERIFGITYNSTSTSPNSVDILLYSVPIATQISITTITPYTWETSQTKNINVVFGYNERLDLMNKNALRSITAIGAIAGSLDFDFLLENVPTKPNNTYSNTIASSKVIQEKWVNTSSAATIKTIDYTYSGSTITTEVRKVYDITGITVVAQMTINYVLSGGVVISETITRDI